MEAGETLDAGLRDAHGIDSGFSPPMLAWVLREFRVQEADSAGGLPAAEVASLALFMDDLVEKLVAASRPEQRTSTAHGHRSPEG